MKYFSHIFLSLLMFSISQKLLGDDRSVADTAAAEGSKNISTVAITAVKSDTVPHPQTVQRANPYPVRQNTVKYENDINKAP